MKEQNKKTSEKKTQTRLDSRAGYSDHADACAKTQDQQTQITQSQAKYTVLKITPDDKRNIKFVP